MKTEDNIQPDKQVFYRLIALWVMCEAVLGGMMHAIKVPFTGMIVSSGAVICICLIGYYVPVKGAILKATIIVAIFKMMLSPHTPPTAYLAVFFQGMLGQLLFSNLKFFRFSCILLGMMALVESAIQRIIVLTILYGNDLWYALNEFIRKVTGEDSLTNYSLSLGIAYVLLHAVVGAIVGSFAGKIILTSGYWRKTYSQYLIPLGKYTETDGVATSKNKKKKKLRFLFIMIWVILAALFVQSYFSIGTPLLPSQLALKIILRSIFILLTWYFIVSPLITSIIKKWLTSLKLKSESDISQVMLLLPATKHIFVQSWNLSASLKGWKRLLFFSKIILVNTLR